MKSVKRVIVAAVAIIAVAGVYTALRNLPIVSGCGFYGDCPQASDSAAGEADDALAATPIGAVAHSPAP